MISKTLSVSPARKLRSDPGCPQISPREIYHARPALLTVFSITQSDHSISLLSVHDITDLNMLHKELQNLIERLDQPIKLMLTRKMATLKALFKSQNPYEMNSAFFSSILKI